MGVAFTAAIQTKKTAEKIQLIFIISEIVIASSVSIILFIEAFESNNSEAQASLIVASLLNIIGIILLMKGLHDSTINCKLILTGFLFLFITFIIVTNFYKTYVIIDQGGSVSLGTFASIMILYIYTFIAICLTVVKYKVKLSLPTLSNLHRPSLPSLPSVKL